MYKSIFKETNFLGTGTIDFTDFDDAYRNYKLYAGYVFIQFREGSKGLSGANSCYSLNGTGDTWFRNMDHHAKGYKYGLAITNLKLTTKTPTVQWDKYKTYKAIISYEDWNNPDEIKTEQVYLSIYIDCDDDKVFDYIKRNMAKWRS